MMYIEKRYFAISQNTPVKTAPKYASLQRTRRLGKILKIRPKSTMLPTKLISGRNLAMPEAPTALPHRVRPNEANNPMNTMNDEPIVMALFRKKGRSLLTFQMTFRVDSIALNMLADAHMNPMKPMTAMAMEVCLMAVMFRTISSMPTGKTCLMTGMIS